MSKVSVIVSAFALAAVLGVSAAQAGGHTSSTGLLGLNVVAANIATAKVNVGSTGHGQSLISANVNIGGGRQIDNCGACGGHDGGVGGGGGW